MRGSKMLKILGLAVISICLNQAIASPEVLEMEEDVIHKFLQETYKVRSRLVEKDDEDVGSPLMLTPYIEQNKLEEAREAAAVDSEHFLSGIDSYSGFLTVNKEYNANLWFWYFPVMDQPVEDTPWMIWLQGGPGVSSLFGLFSEIGPYTITKENKLEEMMYSWGRNHSLLFFDQPVGTGYSFTDDERGYATNQTTIGENLYTAIQQFLAIFPELRKAPLTIAGESYAGKCIPSMGMEILRNKDKDAPINLYGLAMGNGFTDPVGLLSVNKVVREIGLVDDRTADVIEKLELAMVQWIKNDEYLKPYYYYSDVLDMLLSTNITNLYNYLANDELTDESEVGGPFVDFIQRPEVRRALHVGNTVFANSTKVYLTLYPENLVSVKPQLEELLNHYKVLVYNGPLDLIVPYKPLLSTYESLSYSGASEYRNAKRDPWYHDGIIAGYVKKGGNLLEVMVRGAGHMVPMDKPAPALALITAFLRDIPLDKDTASLVSPKNAQQTLRRRHLPLY